MRFSGGFGQPVLIDFERSIFSRENYSGDSGAVLPRESGRKSMKREVLDLLFGQNRSAARLSARLLRDLGGETRRILVVGGGSVGSGAAALYSAPGVEVVGTDVYASENTMIISDAHQLPFDDGTFDAVWIQAVLEHVLEPNVVAKEIHRVLRPGGLLYADTPFMQQVHEGAYDFTRFTFSGHRWLFRNFEEIESGTSGGAGTALIWSVRYFLRAIGLPHKLASLASYGLFWLRFFDSSHLGRNNADAASGLYFYGRRSPRCIAPVEMVAYYDNIPTR